MRAQLFHVPVGTIRATSYRQLLARTEPKHFFITVNGNLVIQLQRLGPGVGRRKLAQDCQFTVGKRNPWVN